MIKENGILMPKDPIYARPHYGKGRVKQEGRCDMEKEIAKLKADRERRRLMEACWTCPKFGVAEWGGTSCTGCKPDCPRVARYFEEKTK